MNDDIYFHFGGTPRHNAVWERVVEAVTLGYRFAEQYGL
jgi:hypothetical protein